MRIEHLVYDGRGYSMMTTVELREAGVPQAAIDAVVTAKRRELVKAECARRIYGIASQSTQTNWTAACAVIGAKTVAQRTDPEKAVLAGLGEAIGWVNAMRAAVAPLTADVSLDYLADASWPACPQSVLDIVAQF